MEKKYITRQFPVRLTAATHKGKFIKNIYTTYVLKILKNEKHLETVKKRDKIVYL